MIIYVHKISNVVDSAVSFTPLLGVFLKRRIAVDRPFEAIENALGSNLHVPQFRVDVIRIGGVQHNQRVRKHRLIRR